MKRRRRKRGRPPKNDQLVVDLAAALMKTLALGPQEARDLASAWLQGREVAASRLPRGARKAAPGSTLIGYRLPTRLESRAESIRRKRPRPRPLVVAALSEVVLALVLNALASLARRAP